MVTFEGMVDMINDQTKPFTEERFEGYIIRHFDASYPDHLFKWHWDEEDRIIQALEDSDWRFQYDNELPIPIEPNHCIDIPAGAWHRIHRGSDDLIIKINFL